jgi:gliding motility-associated-like protein
VLSGNPASAQCPITVNAGPDRVVCNPGDAVTLNGNITGSYLGFQWSPANGLSDPNDLTPDATVTGTATYTLTAAAVNPSAINLVTNPGFESGNTGFFSNYTYSFPPITPGTFVLTSSPSVVWSTFPPCVDHTMGNGAGQMMLVNGAAVPDVNVWCQTIPVTPNTFYVMSAWVTSSPIDPAQLQFSVNGDPVGSTFSSSGAPCAWEQFSATWFSGTSASATLCITNQNSGNGLFGDDFALDDIYFAAACSVSDQVTVSIATVNAVLPATTTLPCNAAVTGIVLNGSGSTSGPGISYNWTTTGGNILSGANSANATVNATGDYTLTVTYTTGSVDCTDDATISVLPDPNTVEAVANAPDNLDCDFPAVMLDGNGSSAGPTISYQWTPATGLLQGANTLTPTVNLPGTYTLTVTNSISGCTATASATVIQNITPPTAAADAPGSLGCNTSSLTLSGAGSSTGGGFTYLWTTSNGNIVSGETSLNNCLVNAAGTYTLTVTNVANGCTAAASTTVTSSGGNLPVAVIAPPAQFTCTVTLMNLNGSNSTTGNGISYQWTTVGGNIVSGDTTLAPLVNMPGTYTLTVTNGQGCTSVASVQVQSNATPPVAVAGQPLMLDCNSTPVLLNGNGSSTGASISYLWTTTSGNILSGNTTLTPSVNAPGTYLLTVSNSANNCTAAAPVVVSQNTNAPTVVATVNDTLDCLTNTLIINANGSSTGANIQFAWTTVGGHFSSGQNTLTPSVDAPGAYTLTLTNTSNNCVVSTTVQVLQDTLFPVAEAGPAAELTCLANAVTLNGNGSNQGNFFTYQWTTSGGNISQGATTLSPTVTAPGAYVLTVRNTANGCSSSDSVNVSIDTVPPVASAGLPQTLTCNSPVATLDGSASSSGTNFVYHWTFLPSPGATGGIIAGANTAMPQVNEPGLYVLTVTDTTNGCVARDTAAVSLFADFPQAQIAPPVTLTCIVTNTTLLATASQGAIFSYQWTTQGGSFLSPDTILTPVINAPGAYFLTVTNELNGCTALDVVVVSQNITLPTAEAGPSVTLSCMTTEAQLNGAGSSTGPGFGYLWTTINGNISFGANTLTPTVNAAGVYSLTVRNNSNGCLVSDTVAVLQDANSPVANAGASMSLTCLADTLVLDGSNSSAGPGIVYQWTTQGGHFIGGQTTLMPSVDAPGVYLLTVTNLNNNCASLASVQVVDYTQPPFVNALTPATLTCTMPVVTLAATVTGGGSQLSYLWTTTNGHILSGATTAAPTVDSAGSYLLTVVNLQNGCAGSDVAVVSADNTLPLAVAAAPQSLTCTVMQVALSGVGSTPGNYLWTAASGGNISSGETTLAPVVTAAGDYTLVVTNPQNGCTASASATVAADTVPPVADAGSGGEINCMNSSLQLDGNGSSQGAVYQYQWVGAGILSGGNTLYPTVDEPGVYLLIVTNQQNGCADSSSATVTQNFVLPFFVLGPVESLTCNRNEVVLDASASTAGNAPVYFWTTANGHFVAGENTLAPTVDAPGDYVLTLINTESGCQTVVSVLVSADRIPPTADAGQGFALNCNTTQASLQGTTNAPAGSLVSWSFEPAAGVSGNGIVSGGTTLSPAANLPGTYFLEVISAVNGCKSTDSTVVTSVAPVGFSVLKTNADCLGNQGSIEFTNLQGGVPPLLFSIDDGVSFSPNPIFKDLEAGVYESVIQDADGCEARQTTEIFGPPPLLLTLESPVVLNFGDSYQFNPQLNLADSAIASITWSPTEGLDCSDCLTPVAKPVANAVYTLTVTAKNGCTASASVGVEVKTDGSIFVPNAFSPNDDGINDVLVVFSAPGLVAKVLNFNVFTRWGESVFSASNLPPNDLSYGWDGTHRGQELGVGVYAWFAEVELTDGSRMVLKGDVVLVK